MKKKESKSPIVQPKIKNPALLVTRFAKFNSIVLNELNLARTSPMLYCKKLKRILSTINDDNILNINGYEMPLTEGKEAFEEAIAFLKSVPNLDSLSHSNGISQSAEELLSLATLHDGIYMSEIDNPNYDLEKRLNHYGTPLGELNELIDYGTFDPEYVIVNFIVCDGDKNRRERKIVFSPNMHLVGIASGLLPSEKICTVLNLAEYFFAHGEMVPRGIVNNFTKSQLLCSNQQEEISDIMQKNNFNSKNLCDIEKRDTDFFTKNETIASALVKEDQEIDDFNIPEVVKVTFSEKKYKDNVTGDEKVLVKKIIFYEDGTSETTIFRK